MDSKTRTITLTGRAPVKIKDEDWPLIAEGSFDRHDGQVECQANRKWSGWIKVRQHADGRAIVYGRYDYDTHYATENSRLLRGGEMLAGDNIPAAISRVARGLLDRGADEAMGEVANECIADLPAEEV